MLTGATQGDLAHAEDVRDLLSLLIRPGKRLRTRPDGACVLIDGGNADVRPRIVAANVVLRARRAGYVTATSDSATRDEVISERGRAKMRAWLMAAPARNGERRNAKGDRKRIEPLRPTPERRSVIEQLALRRDAQGNPLLDQMELSAGLRLAHDFQVGQLQPRVTARWSAELVNKSRRRATPGAGVEIPETASAAQERLRRALLDLGGELAEIAFAVCCFDETLQSIASTRHWSTASARLVLSLALKRLAQHYGMMTPTAYTGRVRQWADADAKPTVETWIR